MVGDYLTINITVWNPANESNATAYHVNLKDEFPYGWFYNDTKHAYKNGTEISIPSVELTGTNGILVNVKWNFNETLRQGENLTVIFVIKILGAASLGQNINKGITDYTDGDNGTYQNTTTDAVVIIVENKPNLKISKVQHGCCVEPGGLIDYTIRIENIGEGDAYNISIIDILPEGLCYYNSSPQINNSGTYQCPTTKFINWTLHRLNYTKSYEINLTLIGNSTTGICNQTCAENYVYAKGYDAKLNLYYTNNDTTARQTVQILHPFVTIRKYANTTAANIGDKVNYTIEISNPTYANAKVYVADKMQQGLIYNNDSNYKDNETYNQSQGIINWTLFVPKTTTIKISYTANVTQSTSGYGTNLVNVSGEDMGGCAMLNISDSWGIYVEKRPILNVEKISNTTNASIGETVNFTIIINNTGNDYIYNVSIEDIMPYGFENLTPITNTTHNISPGGSYVFSITANVTSNASEGTNTNKVKVIGKDNLGREIKQEDVATITVKKPKISITKESLDPVVIPGGTVRYKITIRNEGRASASINLSDNLPSQFYYVSGSAVKTGDCSGTLAVDNSGSNITFSNITINAANDDFTPALCYITFNTTVNNTTTDGTYYNRLGGNYTNGIGTIYNFATTYDQGTYINASAGMYVRKESNATAILQPGDNVTYTITVGN
ncbi:MAG: hypothetical protein CVT88_04095, partial [Candidatus Altiarchaeales archaeon HGW-Altiarchaeales-1]